MKLAIIGSRNLENFSINKLISSYKAFSNISEIVSGGAKGIDTLAAELAAKYNIKLTQFIPDYSRYKKGAPLKRNELIAEYADEALIFWDGKSKGTLYTINCFKKLNKKIYLFEIKRPL